MEEIEILCEEIEDITLEDTREVVTVEKPVYPELENITITPTIEEQTFKPTKYGYDEVKVEPIQDENLKAENIKNGVELFGVTGNFVGGKYKPRNVYGYYFYNCKDSELDYEVSNLDTSNFTNARCLFNNCSNLISLDLRHWNTSKIDDMYGMFNSCSKLLSLDVSNFDTSKVTNMSNMFALCEKVTTLNLSNFNTSNVTNMMRMFYYCSSLKQLDIRNFTFDKVTNASMMFYSIPKDCLIIVKSETEKQWVLTQRSDFTNVKTVEELEG